MASYDVASKSARIYRAAPSKTVLTDSRITNVTAINGGGIMCFGNHKLRKRTGQRHTLELIRSTVDHTSPGADPMASTRFTAVLVCAGAQFTADDSSIVSNQGMGLAGRRGHSPQSPSRRSSTNRVRACV
jgi:hypothetical protein